MRERSSQSPPAAVAATLPESWYADSPPEFRIQKMVEQWQKLHKREKEVAAALRELRASVDGLSQQRNPEYDYHLDYQYQSGLSRAVKEIDATIAKLGLGDQGEERKCS